MNNVVFPHTGLRPVVAIVGSRNAGKSTLMNMLCGQNVAIVSDVLGTTTDAVMKAYELIGFGPVSFYDTAGLDDIGELGKQRVDASYKIIMRSDVVILCVGKDGVTEEVERQITYFKYRKIPLILVFMFKGERQLNKFEDSVKILYEGIEVSGKDGSGLDDLKQSLIEKLNEIYEDKNVIDGLVSPKDVIMLVTPIDLAAPKGKLIMPQMQVLREILDANAMAVVVKETEVLDMMRKLGDKLKLVICDSQVVKKMMDIVPAEIELTTFSTLFARYKGDFELLMCGVRAIDTLLDDDKVLVAEGCSHHVTCDDIGRVKLPHLMEKYTAKKLQFDFVSGFDFPEDLEKYKLVLHCGGCVLNRMEMKRRLNECARRGVKVTNYGIAISYMNGGLDRITHCLYDIEKND